MWHAAVVLPRICVRARPLSRPRQSRFLKPPASSLFCSLRWVPCVEHPFLGALLCGATTSAESIFCNKSEDAGGRPAKAVQGVMFYPRRRGGIGGCCRRSCRRPAAGIAALAPAGSDRSDVGVEVEMTSPCWTGIRLKRSGLLPRRQRVHRPCQNRAATENTATD